MRLRLIALARVSVTPVRVDKRRAFIGAAWSQSSIEYAFLSASRGT